MTDDWIPMRCNLAIHPAVIGIAQMTGLDEDTVVGKLHRIWSWAHQQLESGNAPTVTAAFLNRFVGNASRVTLEQCNADVTQMYASFSDAMQKVGWLKQRSGGIFVPEFDTWISEEAKHRLLSARRVALHRLRKSNNNVTDSALPDEKHDNIPSGSSLGTKSIERKKRRSGVKSGLAPDFDLSDGRRAYAEKAGMAPVLIAAVFEHFLDNHRAKGSHFADWDAAWRTWVRNEIRWHPRNGKPPRAQTAAEQSLENFRDVAAEKGVA